MQCSVNWILSMVRLFLIDPKCKDRPFTGGPANEKARRSAEPSELSICLYLPSVGKSQFRDIFLRKFFLRFLEALDTISIELSPGCLDSLTGIFVRLSSHCLIPADFQEPALENQPVPFIKASEFRPFSPIDLY